MSTRDPLAPDVRLTCDMCGGARERSDRHRLVWDAGQGTELVLAELCGRCAEDPGRVLEFYGRGGHESLRVIRAQAGLEPQPWSTMRGSILRGLVYLLVAVAAFVVVTIVVSR